MVTRSPAALGLVLALATGSAAHAVAIMLPSPLDQDKLHYDSTRNEWNLYDANGDGVHSPGEAFYTSPPNGHDPLLDLSSWMAGAANLLEYEGYSNPYLGWLENGGAPSPSTHPWGHPLLANSGDAFTFDDVGYPHWALDQELGPGAADFVVVLDTPPHPWSINPVDWCLARLAANHPVSLALGTPGALHGITLWGINTDLGRVTITDPDDNFSGARTLSYFYFGNSWVLLDDGTWGDHAAVAYATAIPEPSTALLLAAGFVGVLAAARRRSLR